MKIYVSKAYLEWIESKHSEQKAIKAFNRFLKNVYDAKSVTETPKVKKRDGGTSQGGNGGTVITYEVARTYRLYANWRVLGNDAEVSFCAAVALSKSDEKNQSDGIGKAIAMFKSFEPADWALWKPSPDVLNTPVESISSVAVNESDAPVTGQKAKQKKGKPVDKDGLTPAQRKALQKQQQAQKQKAAQEAARQRREMAKAVAAVQDDASVPVQQTLAADAASNTDKVSMSPNVDATINTADTASVVTTDKPVVETNGDNGAQNPTVTLNGAPVSEPQITGDAPEFYDVLDTQYKLELIERQSELERLQIEIARQKIIISECKIALEKLAIKKLELLQAQKISQLQAQK